MQYLGQNQIFLSFFLGEKNEKCQICGKAFATKGNLKLHVDKHIGKLMIYQYVYQREV